jgi:histidinol dehydrogenase
MAAAILITTDLNLANAVQTEVEKQLQQHPRKVLTEKSIAHYGLIAVVENLDIAISLSNQFAPEHLEINTEDPWAAIDRVRHAGAIFIGDSTPEAVGDYLAGPNHTLPTSGAARYASALGVETFMKHSSLIQYSPTALGKVGNAIAALTQAEGLFSHGESVRLRSSDNS